MTEYYDVCIVGSGFGGAIPALRLSEKGASVVVLERGKYFKSSDFKQTTDLKYLSNLFQIYFGKNMGAMGAKCVGGGSVIYGGVSLKAPSAALEITRNGKRVWPKIVTRSNLEPYYERVKRMLKAEQIPWERIPKKGGVLAYWLSKEGLTCERVPYAIENCLQCGWCVTGCKFNRKQSLILNYIPQAESRGAVIKPECDAREVYYDSLKKLFSVRYVDADGRENFVDSKVLILACGAIETPALLLRSKKNLPGINWDCVGRYLSLNGDNAFGVLVHEDDMKPETFKGMEDGGVISFAYWDKKGFQLEVITVPPLILPLLSLFYPSQSKPSNWGINNKRFVEMIKDRFFVIATIGITPGEGRVEIDDKGEPFLIYEASKETEDYYRETYNTVRELVEKNRGSILFHPGMLGNFYGTLHQIGTCRMGDDENTSVVCGDPSRGKLGEVWGCKNLFITDGSIFSYSIGVNTAFTIAALAEWISEGIEV